MSQIAARMPAVKSLTPLGSAVVHRDEHPVARGGGDRGGGGGSGVLSLPAIMSRRAAIWRKASARSPPAVVLGVDVQVITCRFLLNIST